MTCFNYLSMVPQNEISDGGSRQHSHMQLPPYMDAAFVSMALSEEDEDEDGESFAYIQRLGFIRCGTRFALQLRPDESNSAARSGISTVVIVPTIAIYPFCRNCLAPAYSVYTTRN